MYNKLGPLMSSEMFYSSLLDSIPELECVKQLYFSGIEKEANDAFFEYIKTNLDRTKFFKAIGYNPSLTPEPIVFKQADEAMEYNMVSCDIYYKFDGGIDWYSNHTYNQYEEWTWQLSRHRQILDLCEVYYYTKEEKFAERAVELLQSWIKQAIVPPIDTDGHTTLCWRTIECGIRMKVWAKIIILLLESSALTSDFVVDFFKSVFEHCERLYYRFTAANWLTIEMNGLYVASLLYPFFIRSSAWRDLAKNTFVDQMNEQVLDDGTHYELTFGYQRVSLVCFSDALKLGRAFNDCFTQEYENKLKNQLYSIVKVMTPNGDTPNINDGKLLDIKNSLRDFCELFPEDEFLNFAVAENRETLPSPDFTSVLFENAGFVMFRSDWSKNAIAGFFDGGKFGKCHNHEDVIRCHQHEDKLNFLMYCGEKNIICEAESYAYDNSKMRRYVQSTEGHNTALVNGLGQCRLINQSFDNSMLHSVEDVVYQDLGDIEFATAVYNEGYGENAEIDATHKRTVYFVKKQHFGLPFFVVLDKLTAKQESEFDIVWHFNTEKLDVTNNKALCDDLCAFFAGDKGEIKLYRGSEEPFTGWKANSFTQGDFSPIPTIYYHVKSTSAVILTALVPKSEIGFSVSSIDYYNDQIRIVFADGNALFI